MIREILTRATIRALAIWSVPALGMIAVRIVETVEHGPGYIYLVP